MRWMPTTAHGRQRLASEARRSYDTGTFRREAAAARTLSDLCQALGLVPRGANYGTIRRYAAEHGIDIQHLETAIRRRPDVDREELLAAMKGARSRAENLRLLCPNCHALTPTYRGRNIGRSS